MGCSDPKDRPQDCTTSEFFDEVEELCESCKALREPRNCTGRITVRKNKLGCPEAVCVAEQDKRCPQGTAFQEVSLSCEPIRCDEGFVLNEARQRCEPIRCDEGFVLNEAGQGCEPIRCDEGFVLNEASQSCEPEPKP